jgi:hypothetical protein
VGVALVAAGRLRMSVSEEIARPDAPAATPHRPWARTRLWRVRGARQCRGAIQKRRQASEEMDWVR